MLDEGIGPDHDEESDHTLEQADSTALGEVKAVHHGTVHIGFNDIRCLEQHGVVTDQVVEQAEVALENAADGKQEQDNDGRFQGRQGNEADPLPGIGTVDLRSLHHG